MLTLAGSMVIVNAVEHGSYMVAVGIGGFYLFLGSLVLNDYRKKRKKRLKTFLENSDAYTNAFLKLASLVIKADGKSKDDEYDHIWQFLDSQYSEKKRTTYMVRLDYELKQKTNDYQQTCSLFIEKFGQVGRAQLLYVLVGIATSDWLLAKEEYNLLNDIARALKIPQSTITAHLAMFRYQKQWRDRKVSSEEKGESWRFGSSEKAHHPKASFSLEAAYQILQISPSNTDREITKKYRKLALKYHPDRVMHLGKDQQKSAKEKFQKIAEAYDIVEKSRM